MSMCSVLHIPINPHTSWFFFLVSPSNMYCTEVEKSVKIVAGENLSVPCFFLISFFFLVFFFFSFLLGLDMSGGGPLQVSIIQDASRMPPALFFFIFFIYINTHLSSRPPSPIDGGEREG